jgi:hypothetical protein
MDGSSRANAAGVHAFGDGDGPAWLTRYEGDGLEVLSKGETTAQVDPRRLCRWLLGRCLERGVRVHQPARVVSVSGDARDEMAGVRVVSLAEDGVETDSKSILWMSALEYMLRVRSSTLYETGHNSRALDAQGFLVSLPFCWC